MVDLVKHRRGCGRPLQHQSHAHVVVWMPYLLRLHLKKLPSRQYTAVTAIVMTQLYVGGYMAVPLIIF